MPWRYRARPAAKARLLSLKKRMKVLSIDPGRQKCGIAIVEFGDGDFKGKVLYRAIEPVEGLSQHLCPLVAEYAPQYIVVGNSTASHGLVRALAPIFPLLPIRSIDETNSTLQARELFWQVHPPQGWRRLLPRSLQTPPTAIDDFAAIVIARRFFQTEPEGDQQSNGESND